MRRFSIKLSSTNRSALDNIFNVANGVSISIYLNEIIGRYWNLK
jgi:hypothetical protein